MRCSLSACRLCRRRAAQSLRNALCPLYDLVSTSALLRTLPYEPEPACRSLRPQLSHSRLKCMARTFPAKPWQLPIRPPHQAQSFRHRNMYLREGHSLMVVADAAFECSCMSWRCMQCGKLVPADSPHLIRAFVQVRLHTHVPSELGETDRRGEEFSLLEFRKLPRASTGSGGGGRRMLAGRTIRAGPIRPEHQRFHLSVPSVGSICR